MDNQSEKKNLVELFIATHMPNLLQGDGVLVEKIADIENGLKFTQNNHVLMLHSCEAENQVIETILVGNCHGGEEIVTVYQYDSAAGTWQS